jgi:hypothetical protein
MVHVQIVSTTRKSCCDCRIKTMTLTEGRGEV